MVVQLTTAKRRLTRFCNKLEQVLERYKEESLDSLQINTEDLSSKVNLSNFCRLEEAVGTTETLSSQVEKALSELLSLEEGGEEAGSNDIEQYVTRAEDSLALALEYAALLQGRIQALKSLETLRLQHTVQNAAPQNLILNQIPKQAELPPLPVPKFTGNIWDFDNFWELFNANVHSRDLPELFKFNYLLNALDGEARESVKKFHVTPENYSRAVNFLQARYGNPEELIQKLIDQLDNYKLRSVTLKDQRTLFEQVQVTVMQLKQKGEHVDTQVMVKKILGKFPAHIQRGVLRKRRLLPVNTTFTMEALFNAIEDVLSEEEMMNLFINQSSHAPQTTSIKEAKKNFNSKENLCMFCRGEHKPSFCTTYKTPRERAKYLRDNRLCQLCASSQHKTSECKRKNCNRCEGPHHSSACFKNLTAASEVQEKPQQSQVADPKKTGNRTKRNGRTTQNVNVVIGEEHSEEIETPILQVQSTQVIHSTTFLPIGEIQVVDNKKGNLRSVPVLLDTGAEISFIDSALAEELQLPTISERTLLLHTFGSKEIQKKSCRTVQVQVRDTEGKHHKLELVTHEVLTKPMRCPSLREEDLQFINSLNLPISFGNRGKQIQPLILLGCDQVWKFWRTDRTPVTLPSGLHLLPTKAGNLITGSHLHPQQVLEIQTCEDVEKWDKYWSLEAQINTLSTGDENSTEEELWDHYWTLENEGTQEFSGPLQVEKADTDRQVWDKFNETIERREDGYYVRLPWKDNGLFLPDNKAIALRRLVNTWNALQRNPELLQRYNNVFEEQLRSKIVEDVPKQAKATGSVVHYIPHQAVLTPSKLTTKLRIVFDASAHYKGSPSLNEVLHRGPMILPPLFGILLRFRIGTIGIISDVEKAFLQVRLHESDRDATRCLWLHNYEKPPTLENIWTLRFTRVTFGLNSSPFLLAATTHYHLNSYTNDKRLVEEIKNNLF
uniref:DUF1758 domain-containing protein n=1 Tax=Haemonchus contortus TaxID=6289 RepID=A0A7I4Y5S6_HAECO